MAAIFAAALAGAVSPSLAQKEAVHSVVKVTCRAPGGEWVGSGFSWNQPTQVVTALHVVAGCKGIEVYSEGLKDGTSATVKKVSVASDLALLEIAKTIGLVPVKTAGTATPGKEYTIWGYPKQVRTMQGVDLRFAKALKSPAALEDLMKPDEYLSAVGSAGYPSYQAPILRVSSTIQPGHSGAPIFDAGGNVVGIGDGGLHEGIRGINWAIPSTSLQTMTQSPNEVPSTRPNLSVRFSAPAGEAVDPIALPDDGAFKFAFRASVEEITALASPDEREGIKEILKEAAEDFQTESSEEAEDGEEAGKATPPDLRKESLDVYEDASTGATIALPKGMQPKVDPKTGMLTASDAEGRVTFHIMVSKSGGTDALKRFEAFFNKGEKWRPDPEIPDYRFAEPGSLEIEKSRYVGADPENPDKSLSYSASVDEDSFLGTAIVEKDMQNMTLQDLSNMYLLEMCVELAGFRVD